jgi:hypothetical protein
MFLCFIWVVHLETEARHAMLTDMVSGCLREQDHINPLYNEYQKRVRLAREQSSVSIAAPEDRFGKPLSTLASFAKDYDEWLAIYIIGKSDVSIDELVLAKTDDDLFMQQVMTYATQMTPPLHLPMNLTIKSVMIRVLDKLIAANGNRLTRFKHKIGVNGTVDWKTGGCFAVSFHATTKVLVKVKHLPTGKEVDVEDSHITSKWVLEYNWSDFQAVLVLKPMPAVKLAAFFGKGLGPHRSKPLSTRSKEWIGLVDETYKEYSADVANLKNSASADMQKSVSAKLGALAEKTKTEKAARTSTAVKDRATLKRSKRSISLTDCCAALGPPAPVG